MHEIRAPCDRKLQNKHATPEHKAFVKVRSVNCWEGEVWDPGAEGEAHAVHHADDYGALFGVATADFAVEDALAWSETQGHGRGSGSVIRVEGNAVRISPTSY